MFFNNVQDNLNFRSVKTMGLFGGYENAGPGIPKSELEKKGIFKFFEIYGRKFWKLIELNLIYLLFCIPIITFGPATAALLKIARNYTSACYTGQR